MNVQTIVDAARSFIGTPFQHQGRLPSEGLDCLGVVIQAYAEGGVSIPDWPFYRVDPDHEKLLGGLRQRFAQVVDNTIAPADVIRCRLTDRGEGKHLALAVSPTMAVHVQGIHGRVREVSIEELRPNILDVWRLDEEDAWRR